ncbi:MAG: phosphatase PAP2 family protein [Acidimicrobiia bacterium]|jgi:undecaprenyl-diphosphatase
MLWLAIVVATFGAAVVVVSVEGARRSEIPARERWVFLAVNGLPAWLYWPLWLPMQFGNLVVGTAVGLGVAWHFESWTMALAALFAAGLKLVAERAVRHWTVPLLPARQRPGTSVPGAVRRGRDVPEAGPSFPSGHVILAAAIACVVSVEVPIQWSWIPFVLTLCVMLGRVYVGAHNPLDVTAGLGIGLFVGAIVAYAFV